MSSPKLNSALQKKLSSLNLSKVQRHIILCGGPKCCSEPQGDALWVYLKRRLKELGLVNNSVYRTRVKCLRICQQGPIALVYPEGAWYFKVDESVCERIIHEHLINGRIVTSHLLCQNDLGA